jgi:hypothetical protein
MCKYCKNIEEKYFKNPKEGTLRVWWIPQVPMEAFHFPVASAHEAKLILDTLANYDLFQLEHRIKPDFSNAGGLEVFQDGEWMEWEDENGSDIDEFEIEE